MSSRPISLATCAGKPYRPVFPRARLLGGETTFEHLVVQVVGFIEAPSLGPNLPLDLRGTAFQERAWQALRAIPPGTTVS